MRIKTLEDDINKITLILYFRPITKKQNPIKIKVQGLEYFNDDPTDVSVLFAKVSSENDVLQELSEKTVEYFIQKGWFQYPHNAYCSKL